MLIKPNEQVINDIIENDYVNDLYRKFHAIFTEILHPDDTTYNTELYIKSKNKIEESVRDVLNNFSLSFRKMRFQKR